MSEIDESLTCAKCGMSWCDHLGDGHDDPICPTNPEHRCPSCQIAALRARVAELEAVVREYLEWGAMTGSDRDLFDRKFRTVLAKKEAGRG